MFARKAVSLSIGLVFLSIFCSDRASAEYTVIQLENEQEGGAPQISNNGQVVWQGCEDGSWYDCVNGYSDYEIYLYDGTNTIQLTNNDYHDEYPMINDNGWVVWQGGSWPADSEIYLYDGTSTTQLTNNDYDDTGPQINNSGEVVWLAEDSHQIYLYDGTDTMQLTNGDTFNMWPTMNDNGFVVWSGAYYEPLDDQDFEIFLYDGTNTAQLTNNDYDDAGYYSIAPQINDRGDVVWLGCVDGGSSYDCLIQEDYFFDVFFYNGSSIIRLTNDVHYQDDSPDINNDGGVVWAGWRGNPFYYEGDYEIFLYEGTTITQLTDNDYDDGGFFVGGPQLNDNGYVVWLQQGEESSYRILRLFDGATTSRLTDDDHYKEAPQINNNGQVVWWSPGSDSGSGVFLAIPCSLDDDNDDDGYVSASCGGDDCEDGDLDVNPGIEESVAAGNCEDGIDNDCDGSVDNCGAGCTATAAASTLAESPVYGSEDLSKHLPCFLIPVGMIIGFGIWRRKRRESNPIRRD